MCYSCLPPDTPSDYMFHDYPVVLNADPHRLTQVLSNLLNNAAKYTPEGGRLLLTAECNGSHVMVSVEDNGIGIPTEMQVQIFKMFSQIESSTERLQQGLGVGLTLVKSLIDLHEGTISVHGDGKNQGSRFQVSLPLLTEHQSDRSTIFSQDEIVAQGYRRRVLIVDDNKAAAGMLSLVVKMLGHEVRTAHDGQEAIEIAAEFLPVVILLDIGMPKMNGCEAARHIREQDWGKNMVIVALTGWGQEQDRQQTVDAGFDHHLVKPAEPAAIQELLAKVNSKPTQRKNATERIS